MILIAIEAAVLVVLLLLLETRLSRAGFLVHLKRDRRRLFALPLIVWVPLGIIQLLVLLEEHADASLVLKHYFIATGVFAAIAVAGLLLTSRRPRPH